MSERVPKDNKRREYEKYIKTTVRRYREWMYEVDSEIEDLMEARYPNYDDYANALRLYQSLKQDWPNALRNLCLKLDTLKIQGIDQTKEKELQKLIDGLSAKMEELFEDGGADLDTINKRLDADFDCPRSFMSDLDSDEEEEEEYSETSTWD